MLLVLQNDTLGVSLQPSLNVKSLFKVCQYHRKSTLWILLNSLKSTDVSILRFPEHLIQRNQPN